MPTAGPTFDLQSHSTYSDGELAPRAVVEAAAVAGVELLALTDHDSTEGVDEALEAAGRAGIELVPAVEISTSYEDVADLHVLGYQLDPAERRLSERLARSREDRARRAERMTRALIELGYTVDQSQLDARRAQGKTVGRPHLAQAVVSHPANRARLLAEELAEPSSFLEAYLIEGRPAFRGRDAPSVGDAIELIHGAGGLAVWAHPFWDIAKPERVLDSLAQFASLGLDGVEAFYVTHTHGQTELLCRRAAELGLLTTGSSDFHGPHHRQFHRFRAFQTYDLRVSLGAIRPARYAPPGAGRPSA